MNANKADVHNDLSPGSETPMGEPYRDKWEHLSDELSKLDALIHLQVLRFRNLNSDNRPEGCGGFYITEQDVAKFLDKELKSEEGIDPSTYEPELKRLLDHIERLRANLSKRIENSLKLGIYLPLYHLSYLFHLAPFELDIILVCLAPELDLKYEKLYAYLQDDITKKHPSVNLVMDLLCSSNKEKNDVRLCFFSQSPLLKYRLIRFDDDTRQKHLLSRCMKLDDRIENFLLGHNFLDSRLCSFAEIINPERDWSAVVMDDAHKEGLMQLAKKHFSNNATNRLILSFCGTCGAGKKLAAEALCHSLKLPLIVVDTRGLLNTQFDFEEIVSLLFRETLLQPAAIYFEHFDRLNTDDQKDLHYQSIIFKAIDEFSLVTFLAGEKPCHPPTTSRKHTYAKIDFPVPAYLLRKSLWERALDGQYPVSSDEDINVLANKFQFTGGQIHGAIAYAKNLAMMRGDNENGRVTLEDLYQGCRAQANHKLSEMAQKVIPHYSWGDIVLPWDKLQQLKEICNYVKYRHFVYSNWGFDRKLSLGKGLNALFSGPSGTGKTMAAEIVANELMLDLYKIDLSSVVSKYIGETEKNLSKIFKEAETSNAILFFDEADALFGKRSEVKDAHDRYANIEINYLLQKMEEHKGIVVLATNFHRNIDDAFARRMHFSVEFPFPDEEYRIKIWQSIFPKETPRSEDIDFEFLAKKFKISGGNIKNIALNAAFLAAGNSQKVDMEHIIWATKREYQKMGKLCDQSDFGKYYDWVMSKGKEK